MSKLHSPPNSPVHFEEAQEMIGSPEMVVDQEGWGIPRGSLWITASRRRLRPTAATFECCAGRWASNASGDLHC